MVRRLFMAVLVLMLMALAPIGTSEVIENQTEGVPLIVFLYDRCGGCGVDNPGCGDCKDTTKYHGIIKKQLEERLYDGTIYYRMLNCRLIVHDEACDQYASAFGVYEDFYGMRPMIFIGEADNGVFLVGEEMLDIVGDVMDKYMAGMDVKELQAEIDAYRASKEAEKNY